MPEIASVSVSVHSDAEKALPAEFLKAHAATQRIASNKPIKLSFDAKGNRGLHESNLALGRISTSANDITKSIQAATARTTAFAVTAGALIAVERAFSAILTTTIDVEQQLKKIQIIAGGTSQNFSQFSKGIFDVARETSSAFKETSDAALEFARAGNPLNETLKRTAAAMTLVKIAGVDVQTAVETITSTLNTFNHEVSDSAVLVDKLSNVDANFAVSAQDLSKALSSVGNTATEARVPLDDLLGAVTAVAARTGQSGNVIGNAFRSIFTRIGRSDNVELLNSLGVATEKVSGESRNALDILKDLARVYDGLTDAQKRQTAESIAGLYQIGRFQAIIKDLGGSYSIAENASKAASDSFGSANARIKELNQTTSSLLEQTKTNLTQLVSAFGELTFQNPLQGFLKSVTADGSFLKSFTDVLRNAADPNATKGIGEQLAKGLLGGIGNFIGGPGVIFLASALKKALAPAFTFVLEAGKNFLGINKALQQQVLLQEQVNNALRSATPAEVARINNAKTLNEQMALTVKLINAQATAAKQVSPLIGGLYGAGARPGKDAPNTRRVRGFASGYAPVRKEITAIKTSPDYKSNRDARPQILENFNVGGVPQTVVINSAEKVVPTKALDAGYSGPDQYSILNPRQQKTLGFNNGYYPKKIPNLAKVGRFKDGFGEVEGINRFSMNYGENRRSHLNFYEDREKKILGIDWNESKQKGDGFKNFAQLAKFAKKRGYKITSDTLVPQEGRVKRESDPIKVLKLLFPQLRYREGISKRTTGNFAFKDSEGFFKHTKFSSLGDLYSTASKNQLSARQLKNSYIDELTDSFNSGYYKKKVPNLATPIRLSSGLVIDADKRYVFRSVSSGGQFGDITKKERRLSGKTGFETITEKDLAELGKKDPKSIPLLRITDPSRVLARDFLDDPRYSKLKKKVFVTQSRDIGLDKFQETQKAGGFAQSISLDALSFKTGEGATNSLRQLQDKLGTGFLIKDKKGLQKQGVFSGKILGAWIDYIANNGVKVAEQAEGGKQAVKIIRNIARNPSRFFAQKEIQDFGTEYRVPIVGTRGGAVPVSIFNRYSTNKKGNSFEFSDPEGKMAKIAEQIKTKEGRDILKVAQSSFSQLPRNRRVGVVAGLDASRKGIFELNPSDRIGYSGALDNPEVRGRTASVLNDVTQSEVKRSTSLGLRILNYKGSEDIRKSRFNQFEKALVKLKKDDESAYYQIAANLVRSGFGAKVGRRKKALFGDDASNYFKARGFADGYVPNLADPSYSKDVIEKGNIDLHNRSVVNNEDGSISTVRSMSFGTDQGEVLVPTVIQGKAVGEKEAINHYRQTGEHLGIFKTVEAANKYAEELHKAQEVEYQNKARGYVPNLARPFGTLMGSGAFGEFYNLGRKRRGMTVGKKTIFENDQIDEEYTTSAILDQIRDYLPIGVTTPKLFSSQKRAKERGTIGKEVAPGTTGFKFLKGVVNDAKDPMLKDIFEENISSFAGANRGYLESSLQDFGLFPDDLHHNNYNVNPTAQKYIKEILTNRPSLLEKITSSDKKFARLMNYIGKKGGKQYIFDPGKLTDRFYENLNPEQISKLLSSRQKIKTSASGYIPNLAFSQGIRDAISRESRFVDPSKIYVAEVNTPRYSGPVVANTRDEPNNTALIQAANNASKGYVPNLATKQSKIDALVLQKQKAFDNETIRKFSAELSAEIDKIGIGKLLFGGNPEDIVKKIAEKSKNLGLANGAKFDTPTFREARDTVTQQAANKRQAAGNTAGLGLGIGAPILAGLVDSFAGQTRAGRLTSSALGGLGFGAAIGSVIPGIGTGVGSAIGGVAGLAAGALGESGQGAIKAAEERQKRIDDRKNSVEAAGILIQLEAQLDDLKNSGASNDIKGAKREQIKDATKNITDEKLLKTLRELDKTISNPEERVNRKQQLLDTTAGGISRDQRIEDSKFTRESKGGITKSIEGFVNKLPSSLSTALKKTEERRKDLVDQIPGLRDLQRGFFKGQGELDTDEEKVVSQGVRASVDFASIPENITKDLIKELKTIPGAGFTTQDQQTQFTQKVSEALPENQRESLKNSLAGVNKNDFKNIMLDALKLSQSEQRDKEESRLVRTPSKSALDFGLAATVRKVSQFNTSQEGSLRQLQQASNIEKNAPFVTELTKALEENKLSLEKSISDLEDSRKQSFENFSQGLQKAIEGGNIPLGKIFDELTTLNAGGATNLEKNFSVLLDKLGDIGDSGGNTANGLKGLKDEFLAQNSILNSQLDAEIRQAAIQENTLRHLDKIATNTAAFGGLKGLLAGDRTGGAGTGRNLSNSSFIKEAIRNLPSAGIVGRVERNTQERDLTIQKGKSQLEAAEKLRSSGFREDFLKKVVNTGDIEKGNTADIQKKLIELASEVVESNRLFKDNDDLQRNFADGKKRTLETNDFQPIIDAVQRVNLNLPQNKTEQSELVRILSAIRDEFKQAPEISRAQVARDFGTGTIPQVSRPTDVNLNATTTAANVSNILNTSIGQLNTGIASLSELVNQLITATSAGNEGGDTAISNIANVSITATGANEGTDQLLSKITDALNALNYKVGTISKATKTVIPPTSNNPFSNINNGNVSLGQ